MGQYGTYCGSLLVEYLSMVQYSQLGTVWTQTLFDGYIAGTLVPEAEKMVDTYCGHSFGTPSYGTFTFDGNGKEVLFLPPKYCPMLGIGAGSVDSTAITASNIKVHDQYLDYYSGVWNEGKKNVVLYGSYGYTAVPKDVEYVTAQLCANVLADMVRRKMLPDIFMSAKESGYVSVLFASVDVFQPGLQKMLEPYRITWTDVG